MPYFRTFKIPHSNSRNSDILMNTTSSSLLFDYNAVIFGKKFRLPSFEDPPKPLKFIMREYTSIDSLFVSHSDSIGPLFLKNTKIYLTRPVYEQILLKYEEYKSIAITYDEEEMDDDFDSKCENLETIDFEDLEMNEKRKKIRVNKFGVSKFKTMSIFDANIKNFKNNVVFIRYNHIVNSNHYSVISRACGSYIGWCYYTINFPNSKSISIVSSYSSKRRFSIEAFPLDADYLILNRNVPLLNYQPISDLTKFLRNYSKSDSPILIPADFETFFIELLFHTLSIVEPLGIPISVISPIFNKLDILLNVQSEWLNKDFFTISEPFPMTKYSKFNILKSLKELQNSKNLVFISFNYFNINREYLLSKYDVLLVNPQNMMFLKSEAAKFIENNTSSPPNLNSVSNIESIVNFNIKIESFDEEIKQFYKGNILTKKHFFLEGELDYDYIRVNSNLTVINEKLLLSGHLLNSDFEKPTFIERILRDEKPFLKKFLEGESPIFYEGWFYLIKKAMKFRIVNDQIEYREIPKNNL